jgi:hypothetical protein
MAEKNTKGTLTDRSGRATVVLNEYLVLLRTKMGRALS